MAYFATVGLGNLYNVYLICFILCSNIKITIIFCTYTSNTNRALYSYLYLARFVFFILSPSTCHFISDCFSNAIKVNQHKRQRFNPGSRHSSKI